MGHSKCRLSIFFLGCFLLSANLGLFGQETFYVHVTKKSGAFDTQVLLENRHESRAVILEVTAYDMDGNVQGVGGFVLSGTQLDPPFLQAPLEDEVVFGERRTLSHLAIRAVSGAEIVAGKVSYQAKETRGTPVHLPLSSEDSQKWRIYASNWAEVFDGLAIINTGSEKTNVTIHQRDYFGNTIQTETIANDLKPLAKTLYIIGSPSEMRFQSKENSYFEIVSNNAPIWITALAGSPPDARVNFLWDNNAEALTD